MKVKKWVYAIKFSFSQRFRHELSLQGRKVLKEERKQGWRGLQSIVHEGAVINIEESRMGMNGCELSLD
jgi:hypothetical protein